MYNKTQRKDIRFGGPLLTHDYTYDAANRLINTIVTDDSGAQPSIVRDTDYALDGVGNRTAVTGDNCPGTYVMDPCLPEPADFQMNQYTSTPCDISRSYDKNGNLITIDKGQSVQEITYDYRNQMVEYADPATGMTTTYAYDALGRRIGKIVDSGASVETTHFFYDHWRLVEEQDITGTTQSTAIYGNAVLAMQADTNDLYYHTDDISNVMTVTDVTGTAVERYEYQDYGEPSFFDSAGSPIATSAIGNRHLFAIQQYDAETGWYYYRSRYLDPKAGRSTTRNTASGNILKLPWITVITRSSQAEARLRLADVFTSQNAFNVEASSYTVNSYLSLCISCD
jgi:YD repeat-containing protein